MIKTADLFGASRGAIFSHEKKFRFVLMRYWNEDKPNVMFIGLNPSTANESTDDNTIRKVMKIANFNGYGGIYMLNLFPIVSADPRILGEATEWLMPMDQNDFLLKQYSKVVPAVVFCWGNFIEARERSKAIIEMIPNAWCIDQNINGSPKHPLYCRDNSILKPYDYGNTRL